MSVPGRLLRGWLKYGGAEFGCDQDGQQEVADLDLFTMVAWVAASETCPVGCS